MLQTKNRVKGQSSEITGIFSVVIMLFIGAVAVVSFLQSYVDVKYFTKETSNWSMAKSMAYRIIKCSSTKFGIISLDMISRVKDCLGLADLAYAFTIKDLDTGEQWQESNLQASAGTVKEHNLFVAIEKPDGIINRGVVHVTLYTK